MQFTTLLAIFSAAALVAAAPAVEAEQLDKRYDFVFGCCNPKNGMAWKPDSSRICCGQVGGVAVTERGKSACQLSTAATNGYSNCCNAAGRSLGTPDFKSCTP